MLIERPGRLGLVVCTLLTLILFLAFQSRDGQLISLPSLARRRIEKAFSSSSSRWLSVPQDPLLVTTSNNYTGNDNNKDSEINLVEVPKTHRQIFSVSTANRGYFSISFGEQIGYNPNIIPHPSLADTWIVVAQKLRSSVNQTVWFAELVCDAVFINSILTCTHAPSILPIATTSTDKCEADLQHFQFNIGPHDARVFYGPRVPYAMYGSQSAYTCFGIWMQDFRVLVDWGFEEIQDFKQATDLQRPLAYGPVEKNWFVFWDRDGHMYAHYDVAPQRTFAALDSDGTVGQDLALLAAESDGRCFAKYMPKVSQELGAGSIHQATNSLSVTFCTRADPSCVPDDFNTYIFTIFQQKHLHGYHAVYEPYVMVFQQRAPFEVHAISKQPIWIHGRGKYQPKVGKRETHDLASGAGAPTSASTSQTEMFYVTSMSWATHGQKYHGFIDDKLFIAFGIEDSASAGIDVTAADLLEDLGLCMDV